MASSLLNPAVMRVSAKLLMTVLIVCGALFTSTTAKAITVKELRDMPGLTPEKFASYFANFKFEFLEEVQAHDTFLSRKSGDCDDYATLAADVLSHHGYTPRLIAVRMKGETHVVCYIEETKSYLDYNYRKDAHPLITSKGNLMEIAKLVAKSFGRDWVATYEFNFRDGVKRLVTNIIPNRTVKST
jgi:hypothetical protein